jgi:protein-S-isoprenylcysteine O-methyltransferase Ste14
VPPDTSPRRERLNAWLFRQRGRVLAPVLLVLPFCTWGEVERDALNWSVGLACLVGAFALRVWSRRYIGRSSDTRRAQAHRLATGGPYAWMRNPLYLANVLGIVGACVLTELWWMIPIAGGLAFLHYDHLVRFEERLLASAHAPAADYLAQVSRWVPHVPRGPADRSAPCWTWPESVFRERNRAAAIVGVVLLALLKEHFAGGV